MWTDLPCKNFHLLLCCAILESEKQQIMEKHYGFNEILKVVTTLFWYFPLFGGTSIQNISLELY